MADVVIIHNHVPTSPTPWETPNVPLTDPRYRGRPNFATIEDAETDATQAGHTETEVRE
jgi:hypothetical protein